jgi:2-polyprenyl-3-methyl-5-hydroxy-6-metoxy-1,4-benzoquinol methylase
MNTQNCYLCGSNNHRQRPGRARDDETIDILECNDCGLVFLSKVDHITDEHYAESGMHAGELPDMQSWMNETEVDDERRFSFLKEKLVNKSVIDFGCGTGGFIEKAQGLTKQIVGIEPDRAFQSSFLQRGLTIFESPSAAQAEEKHWDIITAFHVVEHLIDPRKTISELSELLNKGGELIIEVPSANDALAVLYESKDFQNFTYWSQHLYLFTAATLSELAKQTGLKVAWIKQIQRYPISNHLYWMAKGKPGGHEKWHFLNDSALHTAYEKQLAALGLTDTLIAGFTKA